MRAQGRLLHDTSMLFYPTCPAADNARQKLNYYVLNGKPIRIMWAHKDPSFRKSGVGNIFIKVCFRGCCCLPSRLSSLPLYR